MIHYLHDGNCVSYANYKIEEYPCHKEIFGPVNLFFWGYRVVYTFVIAIYCDGCLFKGFPIFLDANDQKWLYYKGCKDEDQVLCVKIFIEFYKYGLDFSLTVDILKSYSNSCTRLNIQMLHRYIYPPQTEALSTAEKVMIYHKFDQQNLIILFFLLIWEFDEQSS